MKFFSIFAPRSRQADVAPVEKPVDLALRVAGVFGVPEHHLTPQVRTAFNVMIGEIDSLRLDVEELKLSLAEAEASADHDPLAPVYNRRAFVREASRVIAMVKRHEIQASLVYFDLNNFKAINDSHGHPAGDAVIRAIGEVLVRQTRETDVVGRIGGDEFAVLLTHLDAEAAAAKAETLVAALARRRCCTRACRTMSRPPTALRTFIWKTPPRARSPAPTRRCTPTRRSTAAPHRRIPYCA
jgi:diguanylate cyclase (GGDEF)-like protein